MTAVTSRFARQQVDPDQSLDVPQHAPFARVAERDRLADGACPAGAADPVHVALRIVGHIVVDDVRDTFDVDPAGGDVRRHQHMDAAVLEAVECPRAGILRLVAMNGFGFDVGLV